MDKLDALLVKFQERLKTIGFSDRSVPTYVQNVRYFLDYVKSLGIPNIAEVDRKVIQDYQVRVYLTTYRGKPLAPATQHLRLAAVRTFYRFLLKEGLVLYDPTVNLDLPKTGKLLPRNILSKKDIGTLFSRPNLKTPRGVRDRAIMEVLYSTGLRATELCNLTLNDLDLREGELRVKGKGGKDRIVPLGEVASTFLELYLREARPKLATSQEQLLFLNQSGSQLTRAYLYCVIKRYAQKAGLKGVGTHTFRHTCATHLLKGKADIRQIQKILGHASLSTTQRYTKVEIGDLKRVLKRCHPREKGEIQADEF